MTIKKLSFTSMTFAGVIALAGCPGDDTAETNGETDDPTTGSPTTTPSTSSPPTTSGPTTTGMTDPTSDTETSGPDTESDTEPDTSTGPDPSIFEFRNDPPEAYTQIDRMGLPAVNTGLNVLGDKDAFNAASPPDDIDGDFAGEILDSIEFFHVGVPGEPQSDENGLNDDLEGLELTVCAHQAVGMYTCDDQLGPLIAAGDQISVDTAEPAGFPNGRQPQDAVMDGILAAILLDIASPANPGGAHTGAEFYAVPVNPLMNDAKFPGMFPWFAPANP